MNKIELGVEVEDLVTGFKGMATSITTYLNGCVRYGVDGRCRDGKRLDAEYFDAEQLRVIGPGIKDAVAVPPLSQASIGGPAPAPRRESTPPKF